MNRIAFNISNTIYTMLIACFVLTEICFAQGNYKTYNVNNDLAITQISEHCYVHISYAMTGSWGRIPSNGCICVDNHEALLFDTPVSDSLTAVLIHWIQDSFRVKIIGFVPNHFHDDCMGGLNAVTPRGHSFLCQHPYKNNCERKETSSATNNISRFVVAHGRFFKSRMQIFWRGTYKR